MADYFSRLPESLIHHILSFLPSNEIYHTCVLSKYFNSVWNNCPYLDFFFDQTKNREKALFDRIEYSLGQCLVRRPFIQKLCLQFICFDEDNLTTKLDRWLGLSIKKNVSRLMLTTIFVSKYSFYSVPQQVFVARTLEHLYLGWCTLKEDRIAHIELPLLEKLSLCACRFVGDNLLQKILCGSPKIKHISLEECRGLGNSLSVSCIPLLKYIFLKCEYKYERIKIDAPSLHTFSYDSSSACDIDLTACRNLKELYLNLVVGTVLEELQPKFLGIQVLQLSNCCLEKEFKICSPSLKRLILYCSQRFNDIDIDAPNLQSFEFFLEYYTFNSKFKFGSWSIPKVDDIHMKLSGSGFREARKTGLKDFLMKLSNYEDLKLLIFNEPTDHNMIMIVELHAVSFYSLQEFTKGLSVVGILISSRDETNLAHKLATERFKYGYTISMMCNSRQNIESYCNKFRNWSIVKDNYDHIKLVSPSEIQKMSSDWESFVKSNSRDINQNASIILHAPKGSIQ